MSKITPPPAMTDEQIDEIVAPLYLNSVAQRMGREDDVATVRAANAARDKQWLDMLAQQEPVAWQ